MQAFIGLALAMSTMVAPGQKIITTALEYKVDPVFALNIAKCESGFREKVYGDSGKAYGIYQFHKPTFELFKKKAGAPSLDYKNPDDQIELAVWAFANGLDSHWSCTRIINDA